MSAPTFTCPKCGRTSHNPHDAEHGYCGACHEFTGADFGMPVHRANDWEFHNVAVKDAAVLIVDEAPIKIGERVRKCNSEPGDSFVDGTGGTVVSGIRLEAGGAVGHAYFVHFDPMPGLPVFITEHRIERSQDG